MMSKHITIHFITDRTYFVIFAGELVEASAPELVSELGRLLADGAREVVLDLIDVTVVDSSALRALLDVGRRARPAGARITIASGDPKLARMLELVGLQRLYEVESNVTDAFARVAERSRGIESAAA